MFNDQFHVIYCGHAFASSNRNVKNRNGYRFALMRTESISRRNSSVTHSQSHTSLFRHTDLDDRMANNGIIKHRRTATALQNRNRLIYSSLWTVHEPQNELLESTLVMYSVFRSYRQLICSSRFSVFSFYYFAFVFLQNNVEESTICEWLLQATKTDSRYSILISSCFNL